MQRGEEISKNVGPVVCAMARTPTFDVWTALVAPGDVFRLPRDVLMHPTLSHGEKRTILVSWASDAHAMEQSPSLRCLPGSRAEPVALDAILTALAELDAHDKTAVDKPRPPNRRSKRRQRPFWAIHRAVRPKRDDDDDPPPCPAAAMPRPRPPASNPAALAVFA